jgi:hypothetical protein
VGLGKLEERTGKRGKFSKWKSIINKLKKRYMASNIPFYLCSSADKRGGRSYIVSTKIQSLPVF